MKIEYKTGDLLECDENIIMHGCNGRGVMGSGVAKLIKEQHPNAYETYRKEYNNKFSATLKPLSLGSIIVAESNGKLIINAITQENYGRDENVQYTSYDAITNVIKNVNMLGVERVALPMIGAGLGNGKWSVISAIIEEYAQFVPVVYQL